MADASLSDSQKRRPRENRKGSHWGLGTLTRWLQLLHRWLGVPRDSLGRGCLARGVSGASGSRGFPNPFAPPFVGFGTCGFIGKRIWAWGRNPRQLSQRAYARINYALTTFHEIGPLCSRRRRSILSRGTFGGAGGLAWWLWCRCSLCCRLFCSALPRGWLDPSCSR